MAPRIGGRKPNSAGRGGNGRHLTAVDNKPPPMSPEQIAAQRKAQEEAEAIQLRSVVALVKGKLPEVEAAAAALKTKKDELGDIFRSAKMQSKAFERGVIMELVNDSKPKERKNVEETEARRYRFRLAMGLPVGRSDEQRELDERLPDVEREGAFWFSAGYTAGISGDKSDAPEPCVRAGHDNRFLEGVKAGQAVLMTRTLAKSAPKSELEPEETPAQKRKREAAEIAAAKAGLAALPPAPADDAPPATPEPPALDPVQEAVKAATPDTSADDFAEATPEELAAQTPRAAVQAVREAEADTDAESV